MAVGAGVRSILERQEYRIQNNSNLPIGDKQAEGAASTESEPMTVMYLGTSYPVFIPGVSDPDGTGDDLHIIP